MQRAVLTAAHWDPEHAPFERLNPGRSLGPPEGKAKAADRLSLASAGRGGGNLQDQAVWKPSTHPTPAGQLPLEALGPPPQGTQPHRQMELDAKGLNYRV